MVPVPERFGGQPSEEGVLLCIGHRDQDRAGLGGPEYDLLKGVKLWGVYMLDHLQRYCDVKAGQPLVPVGEGTVQQGDALPLLSGQGIETQAQARCFQRPVGDVQAGYRTNRRLPGVSGQAFRCWRVWYGGVSLASPVSGATCYRERLSEEIKSAADSLSRSLP